MVCFNLLSAGFIFEKVTFLKSNESRSRMKMKMKLEIFVITFQFYSTYLITDNMFLSIPLGKRFSAFFQLSVLSTFQFYKRNYFQIILTKMDWKITIL